MEMAWTKALRQEGARCLLKTTVTGLEKAKNSVRLEAVGARLGDRAGGA